MSSVPTTASSSPKVEDLVKKALKEALEKRKIAKEDVLPSDLFTGMIHSIADEEIMSARELATPYMGRSPLGTNQQYFSIVTRNTGVKDAEDFPVTVFNDHDWDERIASFIPKEDFNYVIDKDLASSVLRAWEMNEKVLCYGPTGAGKSSLIEQLCAATKRPFIRVNCTGDMDSSMIFGQLTAKDGSTHWVDGAVTEAVKYGAVFAWDEWDVTPPEISMGLQWLLEDEGKLFLKEMPGTTKDKQVFAHEHFRLVAIGNTQGQGDDTGSHAGTNVQNSATLDRFGTAIFVDYLKPDIEKQMLLNKWSSVLSSAAAGELVKLANLVRQGYKSGQFNLTISPRSLFSICKKLSYGSTLHKAYEVVYLNKLNDTQRKVADELFIKIYGKVA
ncbi:COG0714 MoxR-like ATPases [uncultured Caudovirales phage]|uniref:COG0714 MoxR-like ATPases n=1 Tax=uncultured Caudovirales phage TaxID=2100421 RepID=A0A6J5T7D2_9CAUD|nr:COG0714 MoxR-like ATPases [uncultured Caudovirales phage]